MEIEDDENKKKAIIEAIEKTDLPETAKEIGIAQAAVGTSPDNIIAAMSNMINSNKTEEAERKSPLPKIPNNYNRVEKQIAKMLMENTGVEMGDSGGENGRAWQQNRLVGDFKQLPAVELDIEPMYEDETIKQVPIAIPNNQTKLKSNYIKTAIPIIKKAPKLILPQKYSINKKIEYIKEPEKESAQKEDSNKERRLRA